MLLMANGAMFLIIVAMADISETFNWPRGVPSTAYALQFVGGGLGCIAMGWWLDRAGMGKPALLGAIMIGSGAILTGMISSRLELWAIYGVMIGLLGTAAMFAPLMANITRWFDRNRAWPSAWSPAVRAWPVPVAADLRIGPHRNRLARRPISTTASRRSWSWYRSA